jgi:hypothetical protein
MKTKKSKVMFIPLSATGFSTLYEAWLHEREARYAAGVPDGAADRMKDIWIYGEDHMVSLKGPRRPRAFPVPISSIKGEEFGTVIFMEVA